MPPDSQRGPLPTGPPSSIGLAPNNLGRKEITWLAKNCHPKKLRRHVLSAERKWSLRVSRQFCSEGHSRISRSRARRAALRRNSGSNELDGLSLFSLVACPSAARRTPGERRQLEVIVGAPKNSIRSPTRRPSLSGGSGQYCTGSIGERAQAQARSRRDHKTSEPALVLSKETQSVPKRKDTTCMPPNRPPWAYWDYAPHAAGRLRSD